MELRQLRYFIAVAEERSFSRAAARLHISQPPLSTQIMALEKELGTRLFDRTNRGVSLTAAGSVFYEEMRAVLVRLEHGKTMARQAAQGHVGTLSIGFVSIADYGILPPALKEFRTRFPGSRSGIARTHHRPSDSGDAGGAARFRGLHWAPSRKPASCSRPFCTKSWCWRRRPDIV